jgi:hypothetical protein
MTKRTGRPSLDPADLSVRFTLTLPAKQYDAVYRTAAAERRTVSDYMRAALVEFRQTKVPSRPPSR